MIATIVVLLAQVCVWEAGFSTETNDCAAIAQVLRTRGLYDARGFRAYSTIGRHRTRPWVVQLRADMAQPLGWSERLSWPSHARRWARVLRVAQHVHTHRPRPCERGTDHWAAPGHNTDGMIRSGRRVARCGRVRNVFWTKGR